MLPIGAAMLACTMLGAAFVDAFVLRSPLLLIPLMFAIAIIVTWLLAD